MNRLNGRVAKLEPKPKPAMRPPNVLQVRLGESQADALARFEKRWGKIPKGHTFMVVPETITVEQWRELVVEKQAKEQRERVARNIEKDADQ